MENAQKLNQFFGVKKEKFGDKKGAYNLAVLDQENFKVETVESMVEQVLDQVDENISISKQTKFLLGGEAKSQVNKSKSLVKIKKLFKKEGKQALKLLNNQNQLNQGLDQSNQARINNFINDVYFFINLKSILEKNADSSTIINNLETERIYQVFDKLTSLDRERKKAVNFNTLILHYFDQKSQMSIQERADQLKATKNLGQTLNQKSGLRYFKKMRFIKRYLYEILVTKSKILPGSKIKIKSKKFNIDQDIKMLESIFKVNIIDDSTPEAKAGNTVKA